MNLCPRCQFQSDIPFQQCPNCLDPAIVLPRIEVDPDAPIRLSEIDPEPITGCITDTPFDTISENGVPYGAHILIAGPAGCGKSTWALIVACRWGMRANHAWYIPYERGPEALARDAARLGLDVGSVWVCGSVVHPRAFYARKGLIVIDSLNHMAAQWDQSLVEITRELTHHANQHGTTVISICHVTKEWDIAGPEKIKHEADVVVGIVPGMGRSSSKRQSLQGIICDEKNRYGALWRRFSVEPWNLPR